MNKKISRVWSFRSDSHPGTEYETLQFMDGTTSCNCKGWTRRVAVDGIWMIQIAKYKRDPKDFDTAQLARVTDGLTGSEIENVFVDAMFKAFEAEKEPTDLTVASVLTEFVPLSKLMAEQMTGLRNWVKGRARSATSAQPEERTLRQIAA